MLLFSQLYGTRIFGFYGYMLVYSLLIDKNNKINLQYNQYGHESMDETIFIECRKFAQLDVYSESINI